MPKPESEISRGLIDPEFDQKWANLRLGLYVLGAAAAALAVGERLRGDEKKELGSYFKTAKTLVEQRRRMLEDPASFLVELPEHRTITRIVAFAAATVGSPLHYSGEILPDTVPSFVDSIRTFRFPGSQQFFFEEIDLIVDGKARTISSLAGRENLLIFYNSPEEDRALRILSNFELGAQAMREHGLRYDPPAKPSVSI